MTFTLSLHSSSLCTNLRSHRSLMQNTKLCRQIPAPVHKHILKPICLQPGLHFSSMRTCILHDRFVLLCTHRNCILGPLIFMCCTENNEVVTFLFVRQRLFKNIKFIRICIPEKYIERLNSQQITLRPLNFHPTSKLRVLFISHSIKPTHFHFRSHKYENIPGSSYMLPIELNLNIFLNESGHKTQGTASIPAATISVVKFQPPPTS